jgi:hypothetical protein
MTGSRGGRGQDRNPFGANEKRGRVGLTLRARAGHTAGAPRCA